MTYLPDSNIILRFVQLTDALYLTVLQAVDKLQKDGDKIVLAPQILIASLEV